MEAPRRRVRAPPQRRPEEARSITGGPHKGGGGGSPQAAAAVAVMGERRQQRRRRATRALRGKRPAAGSVAAEVGLGQCARGMCTAEPWCLLIHAEASLFISLLADEAFKMRVDDGLKIGFLNPKP